MAETAAPKLVDQLSITGSNRSGGTPNQLSTLVVADLIKTGTIDEIITKFKNVYKERVAVLKRVLPSTCHKTHKYMAVTEDTLFVVTPSANCFDVVAKLAKRNVVLAGGEHFEVTGDKRNWGQHCVRLSISYLTKKKSNKESRFGENF